MNSPTALWQRLQGLRRQRTTLHSTAHSIDFTGIDFTSTVSVRKPKKHRIALTFIALFGAALALVVLRIEILRLRYELADTMKQEQALLDLQRERTVAVRQLRDPARLRRLAAEHGLAYPEQIIPVSREHLTPPESGQ